MKIKPKYPIKNEDGSVNWKNLFRIEFMTVIWIAIILFLAWAYSHDTAECRDVLSNPRDYCDSYCVQEYNVNTDLRGVDIEYGEIGIS